MGKTPLPGAGALEDQRPCGQCLLQPTISSSQWVCCCLGESGAGGLQGSNLSSSGHQLPVVQKQSLPLKGSLLIPRRNITVPRTARTIHKASGARSAFRILPEGQVPYHCRWSRRNVTFVEPLLSFVIRKEQAKLEILQQKLTGPNFGLVSLTAESLTTFSPGKVLLHSSSPAIRTYSGFDARLNASKLKP